MLETKSTNTVSVPVYECVHVEHAILEARKQVEAASRDKGGAWFIGAVPKRNVELSYETHVHVLDGPPQLGYVLVLAGVLSTGKVLALDADGKQIGVYVYERVGI